MITQMYKDFFNATSRHNATPSTGLTVYIKAQQSTSYSNHYIYVLIILVILSTKTKKSYSSVVPLRQQGRVKFTDFMIASNSSSYSSKTLPAQAWSPFPIHHNYLSSNYVFVVTYNYVIYVE